MDKSYRQNFTVQYCFPGNNASCRKQVRSDPAYIFLFIFLSCISVCTVILNLLVIISISHFKQLHTPTNLLILSLAAADLLVGMFVMPVKIIQLKNSCWYFGDTACSVSEISTGCLAAVSLYSLVLIAVDRYIAVSDPLHYNTIITVCKTSLFIVLGWSVSVMYIITMYYFNDHLLPSQISTSCYGECVVIVKYSWVIIDLVVCFVAPCSLILILYLRVFNAARHQAKSVRSVTNAFSQRHKPARSPETKAAKTLGFVIFGYLACWIPYYLSSLTVESVKTSSVVSTVFSWLIYINSSVNPLIYAIFYPWFRTSVKIIVTCRIFKSSSSRFVLLSECF
ncbi:trace amine-associated receptor 13c-like [Astyanax mexicanus]|uniref:trace amine-associated receptor 13c-like n=1 Tax=Astyanax mexicanus TaxID=7994 RepID=UPI0020CAFBCF|nr:trace amine-associated receptor 13c-like [Astyanax mexicanus]